MRTVARAPRRLGVIGVVVALVCAILAGGTVLAQRTPGAFQRAMTFRGVSMDSADDGWAIGEVGGKPNGVFLHYASGSWSLAPYPAGLDPLADAQAVKMLSPSDGWALANVPGPISQPYHTYVPGGAIMRYDGSKWNIVLAHASAQLFALAAPSATVAWAAGDGLVMRYDGVSWRAVTGPYNIPNSAFTLLRSVAALPDGEAWVAGFANVIYHYDGAHWSEQPIIDLTQPGAPQTIPPQVFLSVHDIAMLDAHHGWAVATLTENTVGESVILRYDGQQWAVVARPSMGLSSLSMQSPTEGWAVGDALRPDQAAVMRCHNGVWSRVALSASPLTPFAAPASLMSVSMTGSGDGWAVGYGGTLLRAQASAWSAYSRPVQISSGMRGQYV